MELRSAIPPFCCIDFSSIFVIFVAEVFNQIYRYLEGSGRTPGPQWNRPESREGRQESAHLQVREEAIPPQVCQRYMDN